MVRKTALLVLLCATFLFMPGVSAEEPDAFYAPPASVAPEPGVLLKSEVFTRNVPAAARAWRILYTTRIEGERPGVSSALVLAPLSPPPGPRPVIIWTHGTTGIVPHCAPSLLPEPFDIPAVGELVANGWIVVATDYPGLGTRGIHPYLVGESEGHAALDAFRAAKAIKGIALQDSVAIWGHSQGGHAALWTAALAPTYSPEVKVLGVAAMAPASDLPGLMSAHTTTGIGQVLLSYVVTAYGSVYPDVKVEDVIRAPARDLAAQMAELCFAPPEALALFPLVAQVPSVGGPFAATALTAGPLGARLRQNSAGHPIKAPVLIAQGLTDVVVFPVVQDKFVEQWCGRGQTLEYWTYAGFDHGGVIHESSPFPADALAWTKDRFAGVPQPAGCHTVAR